MVSVKIFNVWHHKLFPELIADVKKEERKDVVLFGVNEQHPKEYDKGMEDDFTFVFEYDLPTYEPRWQKRMYCQSSCFYHLMRNPELIAGTDYICLMQYDMKIASDVFDFFKYQISQANNDGREIILFHNSINIYDAIGNELMLMTHALPHYNRYFNTSIHVRQLLDNPKCQYVPVVHTYLLPTEMFRRMMSWCCEYMQLLEQQYDQTSSFVSKLTPAEYMERVHGMFLAIECLRPNVSMGHIEKINHIWPLYHNQTIRWRDITYS